MLRVEQNRKMSPDRERNDRMLAPSAPPRSRRLEVRSIGELPQHVCGKLERFVENAVAFERKDLRLLGWGEAANAEALLSASLTLVTGTRWSSCDIGSPVAGQWVCHRRWLVPAWRTRVFKQSKAFFGSCARAAFPQVEQRD